MYTGRENRKYPLNVGKYARSVLQTCGGILVFGALLLQQITHQSTNPAAFAKHQEDLSHRKYRNEFRLVAESIPTEAS